MPIKSSVGDTTTTTATAPKTQSLLMTSLTSPQKTAKPAPAATTPGSGGGSGTPESGGKFEVTQEYIQQTIQNALKKDNLSPGKFQNIFQMFLGVYTIKIHENAILLKSKVKKNCGGANVS